jgi:hypothetical protein
VLDWRRDARGLGDEGIAALLARVQALVGGVPLGGTRFLFGIREMLAAAREIEGRVRGQSTTLLVGFQRGANLELERERYAHLAAGGVTVVAYGVGSPTPGVAGVRWVSIPLDYVELVNQWFLVTKAPEPIAFVGFETSPTEHFGHAGEPGRHRTWSGFASDDLRLVNLLVHYLDEVAALRGGGEPLDAYLVVTDDGRAGPYERNRHAAIEMARDDGARVILYDRSTESYLVDPYPEVGWAGAGWPSKEALLGPAELIELGRRYLADQVEDARRSGVEASALLARGLGADALTDACERYGVTKVFLPAELARPGLLDRVRGNTLDEVRPKLGAVEVFLVDEDAIAHAESASG